MTETRDRQPDFLRILSTSSKSCGMRPRGTTTSLLNLIGEMSLQRRRKLAPEAPQFLAFLFTGRATDLRRSPHPARAFDQRDVFLDGGRAAIHFEDQRGAGSRRRQRRRPQMRAARPATRDPTSSIAAGTTRR